MQHGSDDMDEEFRQAAEGYFLNDDGANWPVVQSSLYPEETTPDPPEKKQRVHSPWHSFRLRFVSFLRWLSSKLR